ncbi:flagellar protein FliT [Clostridium neonatale]|uniref:Flagellar protein FliT n=1 Tax=Clostridium neonatale TaxID=137838 RepID=A0A2A7MKJ9_9CLOT|nr:MULTISPECIES: flagellar protein FliT [Clostridiaceae]MBS5954841.1 flagellar protein FliT [Paraclostridium bifermentans]PEG26770.1 flagellar protein FliT [Clostridium neonatale]PEG32224.1 flagellar protein FliT [Clostridium neonatale]CAI3230871.1 Flagellar protein FliT [Clostridium neonatale]CAI3247530.1 Flagellar protein FliT [Clostridium neonatale]
MRLDELLKDYKDTSLSMVEKVKGNEDISSFLKKRDSIINEINSLGIDKQIICDGINALNIIEIEDELEKLIKDNMRDVKKEIKKIKQSREVYKKYMDFNGNALIFSTKR